MHHLQNNGEKIVDIQFKSRFTCVIQRDKKILYKNQKQLTVCLISQK